jgi:hypothetical protein
VKTGPNYAHVLYPQILSDTVNWTLVSGSFVANSAYRYLVIGNFFSDPLTDTLHVIPGTSLGAYYFVDGVCVTQVGQPCEFTMGVAEAEERGPFVWPNPASDRLQVQVGAGTGWQVFDATGRLVEAGGSIGQPEPVLPKRPIVNRDHQRTSPSTSTRARSIACG